MSKNVVPFQDLARKRTRAKYTQLQLRCQVQISERERWRSCDIPSYQWQVKRRHSTYGNLLSRIHFLISQWFAGCAAECRSENDQTILIVAIYIRVNQTITDIDFIHKQLLVYTPLGSAALRKNYDKMPMISSADFDVNFASNDSILIVLRVQIGWNFSE